MTDQAEQPVPVAEWHDLDPKAPADDPRHPAVWAANGTPAPTEPAPVVAPPAGPEPAGAPNAPDPQPVADVTSVTDDAGVTWEYVQEPGPDGVPVGTWRAVPEIAADAEPAPPTPDAPPAADDTETRLAAALAAME